ncbi:hypothetical protein B0H14DRAFT_2327671, partial [Mycena olivaceomarginata]
IGDVKPKATPEHILTSLETALHKDWATTESDQRCPICLDDYQPADPVMKLGDCRHWLHKECLEQWLKGASTCPVCRKDVKGKGKRVHRHDHSGFRPLAVEEIAMVQTVPVDLALQEEAAEVAEIFPTLIG